MTRGLVDTAGLEREKLLLHKVYGLRGLAIIAPTGRAPYPTFRRRRAVDATPAYAPASFPGPAGLGGNYPAPPMPGPAECRSTVGADCYPVLRGRPHLEAARSVS